MRANPEFIARDIAGELVLVPVGATAQKCDGLITCNEVGALIWRQLEKAADEEAVLSAILEEFEIDEKTARGDMTEVISRLRELNAVIDCRHKKQALQEQSLFFILLLFYLKISTGTRDTKFAWPAALWWMPSGLCSGMS